MIDQLATHCCRRLGALYHIRDYLGQSGIITAFRLFIQPICEYEGVILGGLCHTTIEVRFSAPGRREDVSSHISLLSSRQKASAIGLLCKLYILDRQC